MLTDPPLLTYDDANRLTTLDHRLGAASFARYDDTYNAVNDRTSRGEAINGGAALTDAYGYDATDQVTSVSYNSGRNVAYNYDAVGNRVTVTDNATPAVQPSSYTTNNLNQYTATSSSPALNYDANGNLLNPPGSPWAITYDSQSRPVANVGGEQVYYDGNNRVIARGDDGHGIQSPEYQTYIYDGWNIVEDYDTASGKQAIYVHGSQVDEVLCKTDASGARVYYCQDALGSVTALTDNAGNVVERYTYDVYGLPKIYSGSNTPLSLTAYGNRFLFTGREWFAQSQVYDYRNREYAPTIGRFIQNDRIGLAGGDINLYRYVLDSPPNHVDPSGKYVNANCAKNADGTVQLVFIGEDPVDPPYASGVTKCINKKIRDNQAAQKLCMRCEGGCLKVDNECMRKALKIVSDGISACTEDYGGGSPPPPIAPPVPPNVPL